MAASKSGEINPLHFSLRSLHSQKSASLVAECSRIPCSSAACNSASCPVSAKILGICETIRACRSCMSCRPRAVHRAPSAAGSVCNTRFSLPDESFGRIVANRVSSATIKRLRVRSGFVVFNCGTRVSKSSRADHQFKSQRRIQSLILDRVFLNRIHDRLQLLLRVVEFIMKPDDLIERGDLLFGLSRLLKKCQQLIGA